MAEYIVVVRRPGAPQTQKTTEGFRNWVDTFAEIFDGSTLRPEVFEVIHRTNTGIEVFDRTQMETFAARVEDWTDIQENWRNP